MYREWVVVCVKGAGKANHSHSTPHSYLPPNKDRTRAFPITCWLITEPCCTETRKPRDSQASSGSDPSGWRRLRELFLPKLIYIVTLMALRLGKCSRVSSHYRFQPVYHRLCTINCSSPRLARPGRGINALLKLGAADTAVGYRQPAPLTHGQTWRCQWQRSLDMSPTTAAQNQNDTKLAATTPTG